MIYDYFRVTGAYDTSLGYADLFWVTRRDDNVQDFHTRSGEVLLSMTKIPSDEILESLYKLRIRQSDELKKRVGIVRHGDSSEEIESRLSKVVNYGEEECRSETSFTKL